jgi:hypothetical protein
MRGTDLTTTDAAATLAGLRYTLWTSPKEACTRPPMSTWGPLRVPSNKLELTRGTGTGKDLAPLLSDGGGLAFGDSFALP